MMDQYSGSGQEKTETLGGMLQNQETQFINRVVWTV